MGAANVIPGVSGGTIALLTGIFERLIHAISACNISALQLLLKGQFKAFSRQIDLLFLFAIIIGILLSILSLARLLEFLFIDYKLMVWAYFFGLILASVYYVGKNIRQFSISTYILFLIGTITAASMTLLTPSVGSTSTIYLLICGAIAMCSMILPGLSGSFILLLMGNYEIIINAVGNLYLPVLVPFGTGAILGALFFAKLLSWIFKNYHDQTIAILTGFIFGSLCILWPWKVAYTESLGYQYQLPTASTETWIAILLIIIGIGTIASIEITSKKRNS